MQLTKSLCRRIAAGVLIFSAVLHVVYFALVVSGAVEDTRSSPTNNAMVVTTIFFFIFSSLYIVWKSGGNIWLPLFVTIVNFFFTLMIIALLMNLSRGWSFGCSLTSPVLLPVFGCAGWSVPSSRASRVLSNILSKMKPMWLLCRAYPNVADNYC